MFDIAPTELLLVAVVALVVIGPKDLPKAMRFVGYWVGRARGVGRQFRSGFDSMVREAELHDLEKKWAEENARIMREHPPTPAMLPDAAGVVDSTANPIAQEDAPPVMVEQPVVTSNLEPAVQSEQPVAAAAPRRTRAKAQPISTALEAEAGPSEPKAQS